MVLLQEKNMFLLLLSVSGVGPKAALAILSVLTADKLALAVVTGDVKAITKAAGVGPKLAQRVILELKDKLKNDNKNITRTIPIMQEIVCDGATTMSKFCLLDSLSNFE